MPGMMRSDPPEATAMISTRDLSGLPEIGVLRRLMQSLAMLDAILSPDWEYRYFSFNCGWGPGEQMGSMRDGQGNHYFSLFNGSGCWLKGFDHEAPTSPFARTPPKIAPGVLVGVPVDFASCLTEPAFIMPETTFCIWRRRGDTKWQRGPVDLSDGSRDPDGSEGLLRYLDGRPSTYHQWAEDYYGRSLSLAAVESIYAFRPLEPGVVRELNSSVPLEALIADAREIGFPTM
jgi:hypothetical protein